VLLAVAILSAPAFEEEPKKPRPGRILVKDPGRLPALLAKGRWLEILLSRDYPER
jgi:hypothetical protein